jgi:hypothetical protein
MAEINEIGAASQQAYLASTMYKSATWIRMMAESFREIDAQRAPLDANGPWTARTKSIQTYARFETYA